MRSKVLRFGGLSLLAVGAGIMAWASALPFEHVVPIKDGDPYDGFLGPAGLILSVAPLLVSVTSVIRTEPWPWMVGVLFSLGMVLYFNSFPNGGFTATREPGAGFWMALMASLGVMAGSCLLVFGSDIERDAVDVGPR